MQVHVVSFQSERNGSFMRWAIFPSTTEEFMSNATAMVIQNSFIYFYFFSNCKSL